MFEVDEVDALLFDLGGVVLEIDFDRAFAHWAATSAGGSFDSIKAAFSFDLPYQRHERGEISGPEYFESLRETLGLVAPDVDIEAGWNAIFVGEIEQSIRAVQAVNQRLPTYAFSNSNHTHERLWRADYPRVTALFRDIFVSSRLGLRKPEARAFAEIAERTAVPAQRMLFFDDTEENVAGARRAGLQAVHVRSPADITASLALLG